jgi:hypothetical protein
MTKPTNNAKDDYTLLPRGLVQAILDKVYKQEVDRYQGVRRILDGAGQGFGTKLVEMFSEPGPGKSRYRDVDVDIAIDYLGQAKPESYSFKDFETYRQNWKAPENKSPANKAVEKKEFEKPKMDEHVHSGPGHIVDLVMRDKEVYKKVKEGLGTNSLWGKFRDGISGGEYSRKKLEGAAGKVVDQSKSYSKKDAEAAVSYLKSEKLSGPIKTLDEIRNSAKNLISAGNKTFSDLKSWASKRQADTQRPSGSTQVRGVKSLGSENTQDKGRQ